MGKTSLLARGLQRGRSKHAKSVLTDLQKIPADRLDTPDAFYFELAQAIAEQLQAPTPPKDVWDERRGGNVNFERYLRRHILKPLDGPLFWGIDEADRLFPCAFGSEVFGLFRSWHNERALDPSGPWSQLSIMIAYATEAHLFITDMNQSPFNVGVRLVLEDFTPEQVAELNRKHGSPLQDSGQLDRFHRLLSGHPFLVRTGLREMRARGISVEEFDEQCDRDDGVFADHLGRMLMMLAKDPALADIVRRILHEGAPCPNADSFYRLRSAGVAAGNTHKECRLRCQLYERYLKRRLA